MAAKGWPSSGSFLGSEEFRVWVGVCWGVEGCRGFGVGVGCGRCHKRPFGFRVQHPLDVETLSGQSMNIRSFEESRNLRRPQYPERCKEVFLGWLGLHDARSHGALSFANLWHGLNSGAAARAACKHTRP